MNEDVKQVETEMNAFATKAADRTRDLMADTQGSMKAAMEKSAKIAEGMVELGRGNLEAMVESGRIAMTGMQSLGRQWADSARTQMEGSTDTLRKFAAVKSPAEFASLQSEVARAQMDSFVAQASALTEVYMKLMGEAMQPLQNRYSVAVEKAKTLAA